MNILVSVIIPTYKGQNQLSRAIDSVLEQTYSTLEVIIVDDNNPDTDERKHTENIVSKYNDSRIKYIKHKKNSNGASARNTGINASKGEYITFLDDDDFMFPERIKKMLNYLLKNKHFEAIYSNVILTREKDIIGYINANKILEQKDFLLNPMCIGTGSNIFISRNILNKIKGFDEHFIRHQDLEFMIRVSEYTKILNIEECLVVKSTNGINNVPEYSKFKKTKEQFFEKFKNEINNMNKEEINEFYIDNYKKLYISAVASKNHKYIEEAKCNLSKFKNISLKEIFYKLLTDINMINISKNIYFKLKKIVLILNKEKINIDELEFIIKKI